MANEFIARRGIVVLANGARITGSVFVNSPVSASAFIGDGAQLTNIAYTQITNTPVGIVSSSAQTITNIAGQQISPAGVTSSLLGNASTATSASYALTASYALNVPSVVTSASYALTASYAATALTASAANSITFIPATASYATVAQSVLGGITNAETASYVLYSNVQNKPTLVSGSAQISYTGITDVPVGIASGSTQVIAYIANQPIAPSTVNGFYVPAFATTGSNTFTGLQTFQNILVLGSSSIMNVTSSQVNIGNNKVVLNTNDMLRYGGISIVDSGSVSSRSGSFYWDSLRDLFISEQVSGVGGVASSSLFIFGPRSSAGLGTEIGLTTNTIPKAQSFGSGQHITDSQITDDGTTVTVAGTLNAKNGMLIANSLYTTGSAAVNIGTFVIASVSNTLYDGASFTYVVKNATSVRTGVVMAAWSASVVEFTDTSTADVGNTSDVDLTVDVLAGNARLKATSLSNSWTVKTIVQAI